MKYISREKAKAVGLKWFFVGQRCRRGHVAQRFTSNADCRDCHNARCKEQKRIAKRNSTTPHHEHYLKYRVSSMLGNAKQRAARDGVPFDLKVADVVIPEFCPVLGLRIASSRGRPSDASPSLDKLRPELGYVRGNVSVISNRANRIKMNATAAELRRIADWMDAQ